ncbi:hypothetical protein [Castellaniella sp. S9]|uniref:hypothetical protein n=1 Tax=Castellaniella sp. S9 TaxID=2993652 RepID=UPI0022B41FC3|nr:hypothetical protein [Castellaniella sp. S9]
MSPFAKPSPEEHAELLAQIGALPLRGRAWPRWIGVIAWLIMLLILARLIATASSEAGQQIAPMVAGAALVCVAALLVMAWGIWTSETEISEYGLRQSWITRREVPWEQIQSTKFIPLVASKKLVCFVQKGRPVTFQAGTPELQAAFARISLVYRRRA